MQDLAISFMNSLKIADFVKIITKMPVIQNIHLKMRLSARFGDLRFKTGGLPPF